MNTSVFMGLLCVVPPFLASGFHHLLHVSRMNVVMCFSCKYALPPSVCDARLEYQLAAFKWAANPLHVEVGFLCQGGCMWGKPQPLPAEIRAGVQCISGAWCCPIDVN